MPLAGPKPGDLVVRRNRWSIFAHSLGIVIYREGDNAMVWWSPTPELPTQVSEHIADMLVSVGDDNVEELRVRCLMAQ